MISLPSCSLYRPRLAPLVLIAVSMQMAVPTMLDRVTRAADGPADNQASNVRPIPPPGIAIDPDVRASLDKDLQLLQADVDKLRKSKSDYVQRYLPDVEIFSRAVSLALNEDGFFEPKDPERAKQVLAVGKQRASELLDAIPSNLPSNPIPKATSSTFVQTPSWTRLDGPSRLIVRGFRSKLDGTVQPYGIVQPYGTVRAESVNQTHRADIWCRGRSEKGLELQFLATRMTNPDPMPEPGVFMIHPFGRYCNANKLAGEVDTLEVLEHALKEYPIDPKRIAIRGFSMGGAAAWHLAVHYPDKWFAANPGAGFSETPLFLNVFQSEELKPTWYEKKLWQWYDCPVWARNLRMLPTVAYSGEIDKQKQAADVMAQACWNLPEWERFELTHIVAPKTAHKVDPTARVEIERRLANIDRMRSPTPPTTLSFTTTTLKYNKAHWITINALEEHWTPATVSARIQHSNIDLNVENANDLSLDLDFQELPSDLSGRGNAMNEPAQFTVRVRDGAIADAHTPVCIVRKRSDLSLSVRIRKTGNVWKQVSPIEVPSGELRKKHGLQGPIDDAFMGAFLFVKPTATGNHPKVDWWVEAEFNRAVREWHRQMRGDAIVKTSAELKPEDIENYHLVLWGDPKSNPTLAKIADSLPVQWSADSLVIAGRKFTADAHVPLLIYPNPLNPQRYVVLNSGLTYREYDYLNNARQIPKLPDWAIVDVTTAPDSRFPGKVADADFFDENWRTKLKTTAP